MKVSTELHSTFGQFITRKAQSYTPLQRVLVVVAGVLLAGFLASVIAVVVILASGVLVSDPSTVYERSIIQAQTSFRRAAQQAKEKGVSEDTYTPAVQAKARIILLQAQQPALQENTRKSVDRLVASGTLDPLALYACARAYDTQAARKPEARLLYAKAAQSIGGHAGSISRTIYHAYAQSLIEQKNYKQAGEYLEKAAKIAPQSPVLYVQLGKNYERQAEWYDAAYAYLMAQKFDPSNEAAQLALSDLAKRYPDRVRDARKEVK